MINKYILLFTKIIIIKIHHSGYFVFDTKLILHYSYGKSLTSAKNRQYYNSLSMIEEPVSMLWTEQTSTKIVLMIFAF